MKKYCFLVLFVLASNLFAYNPPASGENLFGLTSPTQITQSSAAGGAFFDVAPSAIAFNPALTAFEQRITLDVGYTALFATDDPDDKSFGNAFQAGILVPTEWGVGTAEIYGVMIPFYEMQLGKSLNAKFSVARDVFEDLSVGLSVTAGRFWGYDTDLMLAMDAGALYNHGNLGFLEDFRIGASVLNLGKTYGKTTVWGYKGGDASSFPGIATLRSGIAGTFYKNEMIATAFSADLSTPMLKNFILDTGLQLVYENFLTFSTSWRYNSGEFAKDSESWLPAFGIKFKFMFNSKNNSFMKERNWQESEMTVSSSYQKMYKHVNAVSGGATVKLGLKDSEAPVIELFGE